MTGVELDPTTAELARPHLYAIAVVDIGDVLDRGSLGNATFDCILLADVLEHLVDPWTILRRLTDHLEPQGIVVTSLPNVRHYTTLLSLLVGKRWPYRDRGIHDRTHLRFFAQRNLAELFQSAGLTITSLRRQYRVVRPRTDSIGIPVFLPFHPCVTCSRSSISSWPRRPGEQPKAECRETAGPR